MSEMVARIANALGDACVPANRYTLRDLLFDIMVVRNGPMHADQRAWCERTITEWLTNFAEEALKAAYEPTGAMIFATSHDQAKEVWKNMVDAALEARP